MNKEQNNLGSAISVVVIGIVAVVSIFAGGKEIINDRIEVVDRATVDRDYETNIATTEGASESLGGLVHNVQEIFSAGIKAGTCETEVINSSGQWVYQFNGTTIAASGAMTITGESNLDTLVFGGDATQLYNNATATAAQVCDSSVLKWATTATTTIQFATGTDLIADCLPAIGDTKELLLWQNSTTTSGDGDLLTIVESTDATQILLEDLGGTVVITKDTFARIVFTNINGVTTTVEVLEDRDAD